MTLCNLVLETKRHKGCPFISSVVQFLESSGICVYLLDLILLVKEHQGSVFFVWLSQCACKHGFMCTSCDLVLDIVGTAEERLFPIRGRDQA